MTPCTINAILPGTVWKGDCVEAQRVLIVCEPGLFAQAMRTLLESDERIKIVGLTGDAREAAQAVRETNPAVVMVQADQYSLKIGRGPQSLSLDWAPLLIAFYGNDNVTRVCRIEERALTCPNDLIETLSV